MKRIILTVLSTLFLTTSAFAVSIGLSGTALYYDASGTETTKSSNQKNEKSENGVVPMPSLFIENELDTGIVVGIDFVPASAKAADFDNARTDTDTDDASDTAGDNKVSAELTSHTTLYLSKSVGGSGAYFKGGVAFATIDTTENLATGTAYGNEDVTGILVGVGFNRDRDNGTFLRTELTYSDYEEVKFTGSADADGVKNVIDADIDAIAFRVSLGKAF